MKQISYLNILVCTILRKQHMIIFDIENTIIDNNYVFSNVFLEISLSKSEEEDIAEFEMNCIAKILCK